MAVFITGGTGFIGTHFLMKIIQEQQLVYVLRRPGTHPSIVDEKIHWIEGYFSDDHTKVLQECNYLVHLAAHSVIPPFDTIENCIKYNVIEPLALFKQALESGVIKFMIMGSCFEYGLSGNQFERIPVYAPLQPTDPYSISKAAASIAFSGWAIMNNVELKYLRLFHVYGEGESPRRLWPSLKTAALNGDDFKMTYGEQVRDFSNVDDIAAEIIREMDFSNVEAGNPVIKNISSGRVMTVKEFANYWWTYWGAKGKLLYGSIPYRDNEVMRYVPEI